MEDKELQQLIEAKLWQLENQRQQEEIASRIGRKKIVWPWWLGTAAAAILAAVLLSPVLFGGKEDTSTPLIAKENVKTVHSSFSPKLGREMPVAFRAEPCVVAGDRPQGGGGVCKKTVQHTPPSTLRAATPSNLEGELADAAISIQVQPAHAFPDTIFEEFSPNAPTAPRVHTRQSNRLGDIKKAPEKSQVPALIAHYVNIPDTVLFTSNIVITLK